MRPCASGPLGQCVRRHYAIPEDCCMSLSNSGAPFVFCCVFFLEMCTKLYNEDEFQPLDPSQEPIFPPELIVSCFALVVS